MNTEQALQILSQLIQLAPVPYNAHAQGQQALLIIQEALENTGETPKLPKTKKGT